METRRPLIVDIRRGSVEDGPGIRTVVFFKGCPLRCIFCHNPEAQDPGPELAFAGEKCLECGSCRAACGLQAIDLASASRVDRSRCDLCGRCAEACPGGALHLIGKYWPAGELIDLLLRDDAFYRRSGGGVTLSGGECTMFPDYVQRLLEALKARKVHTALETSGCFEYETFARRILPYLDLILFDVKLADSAASERHLGRPSERMLDNLSRLARGPVTLLPRIPLIPGVTDSRENLSGIVERLRRSGAKDVSLLPYNPAGLSTYARLGKPAPELPASFMKPEREREVVEMFREIVGA